MSIHSGLVRQRNEIRKLRAQYHKGSEEWHQINDAYEDINDKLIGSLSNQLYMVKNSDPRPESNPISTLNKDGKSRKCECGARHTVFPNHHLNFCPMKEWK